MPDPTRSHDPRPNAVAAIIAAAPYAAALCQPTFPAPPGTALQRPASVRHDTTVITERAARVVLAQIGIGGGLRAHRTTEGWVFAPYPGLSNPTNVSTTWLVTHDGTAHDLSGNESTPPRRAYGKPITTR